MNYTKLFDNDFRKMGRDAGYGMYVIDIDIHFAGHDGFMIALRRFKSPNPERKLAFSQLDNQPRHLLRPHMSSRSPKASKKLPSANMP